MLPLLCPARGGERKILAFLTDPPTVRAILRHLDLPHRPPRGRHCPRATRVPPWLRGQEGVSLTYPGPDTLLPRRNVKARFSPLRTVTALALLAVVACVGPAGPAAAPTPPPVATTDEALYRPLEAPVAFTVVADTVPDDPALAALVAPFRRDMGSQVEEVIGESGDLLTKGWPEGTLGNFAADAILRAARGALGDSVELAVANNGGLRVPVPPGPITVAKMFELMPFENRVSVVVLTGTQVMELAQHIGSRGGEPVAGLTLRIEGQGGARVARDVRIGGRVPEPEGRYLVATSDYLASGGDGFAVFTRGVRRVDLPLLVRDAFIAYAREVGVLRPRLEGRITGEVGR